MTRCHGCGCQLSRDHQGALWCSPCLRARRDENPRHDKHFKQRLLALFVAHEGERISPQDELGISPLYRKAVQDAIRALRREGHLIEATPRRPGYTYRGQATSAAPGHPDDRQSEAS